MTTERQKAAVRFCEDILHNSPFKGDINNSSEVSQYLSDNLETAKEICADATAGYYSAFDY